MGKLAHMAVSYYDGLPQELLTPQTQVYRGMALIREGGALLSRGDFKAGNPKLDEAWAIFDKLRAGGDKSEQVAVGLALSKFTRFSSWGVTGAPGSKPDDLQEAADLLRPWVKVPKACADPDAVRRTLNYLSHTLALDKRIAICEEARGILRDVGAGDFSDLRAASIYADTSDSQARHSLLLGKVDEAEKLELEVYGIAEKVLAQRPGDLRSMANRALAADFLGRLAIRRHDYVAATDYAAQGPPLPARTTCVSTPPISIPGSTGFAARTRLQRSCWNRRVSDALDGFHATVALDEDPRKPTSLAPMLWSNWGTVTVNEARAGDFVAAERSLASAAAAVKIAADLKAQGAEKELFELAVTSLRSRVDLYKGNNQSAFDLDEGSGSIAQARPVRGEFRHQYPQL